MTASNRHVLQSLKLWKMLFKILVLYQSVYTRRCNVHHCGLQEARCLINHIFDMQWSFHFFSYILMIPSPRTATEPHVTDWRCTNKFKKMLPSPWNAFDSHNTATVTWVFLTTSYHNRFLSSQSTVLFHRTVMAFCVVNTKLCFQPWRERKSASGQKSIVSPVSTTQHCLSSGLAQNTTPPLNSPLVKSSFTLFWFT